MDERTRKSPHSIIHNLISATKVPYVTCHLRFQTEVLTGAPLQRPRRPTTLNRSRMQCESGRRPNPGPEIRTPHHPPMTWRESRSSAPSRCVSNNSCDWKTKSCGHTGRCHRNSRSCVLTGQQMDCDTKLRDRCKGTTCNRYRRRNRQLIGRRSHWRVQKKNKKRRTTFWSDP